MSGGRAEARATAARGPAHRAPLPEHVIWHDLECGRYSADLALWRELAAEAEGEILDVGAGTGRVALYLASRGHLVTALDRDARLLEALSQRAADRGVAVAAVHADARELTLPRRFALILVPMQTLQLLDPDGRARFYAGAARCLRRGGRLAAALADAMKGFDATHTELPRPDAGEHAGVRYVSQTVAVRQQPGASVIERIRRARHPDGHLAAASDLVRLHDLSPAAVEREAASAGMRPAGRRTVPATDEHVGSQVVILRA